MLYFFFKTYLKNQVLSKHGLENGKAHWSLEDAQVSKSSAQVSDESVRSFVCGEYPRGQMD